MQNDVSPSPEPGKEHLRRELQSLQEMLELANSIIIRCDQQGNIKYVNQFGAEFFGYTVEEMVDHDVRMIVPEIEQSTGRELGALVNDILKNPERYQSVPSENITKDGRIVWVSWANKLILNENSNVHEILTIGNDITELKQAEQALKESEKMFRSLFEHSPEAVFLTIPDGQILAANPAACVLFGYSKEEFKKIGRSRVVDEKHPNFSSVLEERKRTGMVKNLELTGIHKNGEKFPVEVDSVILPGEPIKSFVILRDIRGRKQAEERLREAEQKLRLMVENSTNLFYMHTADHVLTYVSPQSRQFFDCEPEEAMVRWTDFLTDNPANSEAVQATQRAIDTGQRQPPYEVECIGKKRRKIWVEVHEAPIIENGRTIAISGTLTDITKRKQAQKEREQFYKFFQTSADLMCLANPDGRFIKTNPAFTEVLGYSEEELVSREIIHFIHPEDRQATHGEIERQKETGFTNSFENRYICKNGDVKWLSWRVTFSKEEGIAYATARDITEKKQAVETLRESRSLLLVILENIPIRVFWKDANLNYLGCNTAFAQSAGFIKPEDLLGKDDFQMCWHKQAEEIRADDRQVMASEVPGLDVEKCLTTPEGNQAWIRTSKVPLYDVEGNVIGMLGIDEDISEQKKKEEEKAKLEAQLHQAQKIESVGRLAGGVAHDYNNMLSVIIGYAELIQMKLDQKDAVQEDLEEILTAARRSRDITRQLLAFARKQTIDPKIVDLNTSIESTLKMLRNLLGENIDLVWKPQKGKLQVEMDPSQLDQVLVNLCINARDAIADVGTLTIETGKTHFDQVQCAEMPGLAPGDYVMLDISDNGCGMAPDILEHIFEPFFTTKQPGRGTGLGLAMVYGVVKQNNGYIDVYSEPGCGTAIKIYLPKHAGLVVAESEKTLENVPRGHGETVLLVEDEISILKLAATQLKSWNYHVLEANTPREALTIAETLPGNIDLLLTDVVMPEMNGKELADRLHLMYPQLRCLYMSGYTDNAIAHHGVLDKGVHFISKPFSAQELAVKVSDVLDSETTG